MLAETKHRRRSTAAAPRLSSLARRLEHAAPQQDPLEIRRRDVVPERGEVERAELGHRERLGREGEADVRVGQLRAKAISARERDRLVVERERRGAVDRVPTCIGRDGRVDVGGDEAQVRSRELPFPRIALRVAAGLELLEVGELPDVDLRCEVAADRLLERLAALEEAARKRPCVLVRLAGTLTQQHLEDARAHAQQDSERDVRRPRACSGRGVRLWHRGRLVHSFRP